MNDYRIELEKVVKKILGNPGTPNYYANYYGEKKGYFFVIL